jgi:saccharopine dehydrogenase-like NADP-dependent oxidoreductase
MKLGEKEKEFTFLQIDVKGSKNGKNLLYRYKMYDERDDRTGYTSMARTTGFPCVIMARLIAERLVNMPGVHAPESIGDKPKVVERFISEMEKRGVRISREITEA